MKQKTLSIRNKIYGVYGYCRWRYEYPPDSWCLFGVHIYNMSFRNLEYRFCFFGFELRFKRIG